MTKNIYSEKKLSVLNILDNPISEIIKQLHDLENQGYSHLKVSDCWGGTITPYSVRSMVTVDKTKEDLLSLFKQVEDFKNKLKNL
jgi:hypothetical protein